MDILSYLTELVKTRKEVGIPGIGTFYKRKSPGKYDAEKHAFVPPSYTLDFTSEVREHTALLDFISQKRNISTDSANYYIGQFTEELLQQLADNKIAGIGELGTIRQTEEGLAFSPDATATLGFDFYGLPSIKEEVSVTETEIIPITPVQPTEEQISLEAQNADLTDGISEVEDDEEPVYEEIGEVDHYAYQHISEPVVPTQTSGELEKETTNAPIEEETKVVSAQEEPKVEKPIIEEPIDEPEANEVIKPEVEEAEITEVRKIEERTRVIPRPDEYSVVSTESQEASSVWTFYNSQTPGVEKVATNANERKSFPLYAKLLIAVIIILAAAAAFYFVNPEIFKPKAAGNTKPASQSNTAAASIAQLKADSISRADSIAKSNVVLPEDTSKKDTVQIKPASAAVVVAPVSETAPIRYEIIAASLANQNEADNFLAQMKKRGIKAKVANLPGKRLKISLGTFTEESAAKKELELLKESTKIPEIYILPVKHTNTNHK